MFPFNALTTWTPEAARARLRSRRVPSRMRVAGHLNLANCSWLTYLPRKLEAESIDLSGCPNLRGLPEYIKCDRLILRQTNIKNLQTHLDVARQIDASDCRSLEQIFPLRVPDLRLPGCTALQRLPDGLRARWLDVSGCTRLVELPASMAPSLLLLDVSGCTALTALPQCLTHLQSLNVRGSTNLHSLPDDICVQSWIEVADSGLTSLPYSLRSTQTVWRGMRVPDRVAFHPETITVEEILAEQNVELRRVLIERVGMEWFYENARPQVVDTDFDAGGERRLLRLSFQNGPATVCLEVHCPSTGRKYLLQLPPQIPTCAQGAAWLAGFNNANHYRPVLET